MQRHQAARGSGPGGGIPRPQAAQAAALPAEPSRFVGRERELAALARLVERERLVTIVGPPGAGKTRSALRLARTGPLPVVFVDLVDARTAADLHLAVAQALGLAEGGAAADLGAAIAARGEALFLLDNVEYVAGEAGPILEEWLARAPAARFLLTSVARLGIAAEACYELHGLALDEAVELYAERARRVASDFELDRSAVERLVERLDRMPLAIELAAGRARVLRARQLLARLEGGLDVLRAGRAAEGRHASVVAAIRWSWSLLAPWEADALAQCALFAGGFTVEAAESVVDLAAHAGAPPLLDVLEALRDKSFLQLEPAEPPRLRMLESIRAVAAEALDASGAAAAARARHARFYVELADRGIDGAPDTRHVHLLLAERENVRAAHRHAAAAGDPAEAARACLAFARVLALRGPPVSEVGILEEGLDAARRAGDDRLLARLLRARAHVAIRHGAVEAARAWLEEGRACAARAGDRLVETHVSIEQGRLLWVEGRFDEARAVFDAGIDAARAIGCTFLEGYALNLRGMVAESRGRLAEGAADFERALEIFRRVDNRRFEAIALMNLGVVHANTGRNADAATLFEKARAAFAAIDDRAGVADAVINLGGVHLAAGALDEAEQQLRAGLRLEREVGNRRAEAYALASLGLLAHDRGELRSARELLQEALSLCRAAGEKQFHGVFLPFYAAVEASLGHLREARADFAAALAWAEALGDPGAIDTVRTLEGFLELAEGAPPARVRARLADARARLDAPDAIHRSAELVVATRLLARALEDRSGRSLPTAAPAPRQAAPLEVGPEATWFRVPGAPPVDLRKRRAPRLILRALFEHRLAAPGAGLSVEALCAAGWPGDRALPHAAAARLYVAIRTLRTLGLAGVLRRQDDGYLLDPATPVRRSGRSI